jgi:hypothetical protein
LLAEVVEDVGEVGEVDGGLVVEVAGGPGGGLGAEVLEDGLEVSGVDDAIGVGVAEESRIDARAYDMTWATTRRLVLVLIISDGARRAQ